MLIRRSICTYSKVVFQAVKSTEYQYRRFLRERYRPPRSPIKNKIDIISSPADTDDNVEPDQCEVEYINEDIDTHIAQLFNYSKKKASYLINSLPELQTLSLPVLQQRIEFLEKNNVDRTRIFGMMVLLLLDSDALEERTKEIARILNLDFNCAVCFVKEQRDGWFNRIEHMWRSEQVVHEEFIGSQNIGKYRNRIDYMAERLMCPPYTIGDMMMKRQHLAVLPFHNIKYVLDLLLKDAHLSPREIINEPTLFQMNLVTLTQRIKETNENKVEPKVKLFSVPQDYFDKSLEEENLKKSTIAANQPLINFFIYRLECTRSQAEKIILTLQDSQLKVPLTQIGNMIDFLDFGLDFTLHDIRRMPLILWKSKEAVLERYERFKQMNLSPQDFKEFFIKSSRSTDNFYVSKLHLIDLSDENFEALINQQKDEEDD